MLNMAGRAFRSECLIGVVQGCIVAREAGLVSHVRGESSNLSNVTKRALLREYGMRMGKLATRVHFLPALGVLRNKPAASDDGNCHG